MTAPAAMTNTILAAAVTQTAPTPTNSISVSQSNSALCGAYTFALSGTYPYLTINSSTGLLTLSSNSLADVGPHTVTLLVTLTSYPTITAASVTFTVTLNDPCPTTSISMTAPAAMTNGVTLPAASLTPTAPTNTVATQAAVTTFCGAYTYSLSGTYPYLTINSSTGLLTLSDTNMANIGTHTVTLLVGLASYTSVPQASVTFTVTLTDPCTTTVLTMPTLTAFSITVLSGISAT
jgi:hypothetical protein